jgi:hypothetical protein
MAPTFRHATATFGLLEEKRKERFSPGSPSWPFAIWKRSEASRVTAVTGAKIT